MQQDTRNLLAAGVAGVVIGALSTGVLMSSGAGRSEPAQARRIAPGIDPDDIVPVLDADRRAPAPSAPEPIDPSVPSLTAGDGAIVERLRERRLTVPVQGIDASRLVQSFDDDRGGSRKHEAIDILAPRHTPVVAVEDGTIARLFSSKAGGITIYQYDPAERLVYYYAHLERYADGLTEGGAVRRGQVIGFVGTSGNAPPNTPHLHFAIYEMTDRKRWWEGRPVDPYLVLR